MDNSYVLSCLQAGNMEVFTSVFKAYHKPLCNYAYSVLHNEEDSKDAVQDVFTKLCASPNLWGNIDDIRGYLYQSVRNRCLVYIRSDKSGIIRNEHNVEADLLNIGAFPDAASIDDQKDLDFKIQYLLSKLPFKRRRVVQMYYYENLSYKETASKLGLTKDTIKTQLSLARNAFREMRHLLRLLIGLSFFLF